MKKKAIYGIVFVTIGFTNCATVSQDRMKTLKAEKVKSRAAFDLNCPKEQIILTEIDVNTTGARCSGSSKQGTYLFESHWCHGAYLEEELPKFEYNCKVLLNNKSGK